MSTLWDDEPAEYDDVICAVRELVAEMGWHLDHAALGEGSPLLLRLSPEMEEA